MDDLEEKNSNGPKHLMIKSIISEAWKNVHGLKASYWGGAFYLFGITFLMMIGLALLSGVFQIFGLLWLSVLTMVILMIAVVFIVLPAQVGLLMLSLRRVNNLPFKAATIFDYYEFGIMWKIFATSILFYLIMLALTFFLSFFSFLPLFPQIIFEILGILIMVYISTAWMLSLLLIADKNTKVGRAVALSIKAVLTHWIKILGILICIAAFMILTTLTLMIGIIWFYPMINNIFAILYRELFGISTEK